MGSYRLPKAYDFRGVEDRLYRWWEQQGYFKPARLNERRPFVISMPPPNITGELHLGHAITTAVEDLMIRHSRMRGVPTLWVPGSDHASIATELQLEKELAKEGLTRRQLSREAFLERAWKWKDQYGGIITQQLRRLGASCDWERERFTMDEGLSRAVIEAFVRLHERGLIYRGSYLINWSPGLQTAVSDLEVEYSDEEATLYYFKYPIAGSQEFIPVATTRPETILGDTAVAVHPDDQRYRHLIGKTCLVPILKRTIPVIHDTYVDVEFGTGALKITPGHDPADYEIGQRHGLPIISVLNNDATMTEAAGPYAGMDRYECRQRMWEDMQAEGLTIKTEPYQMQVPRSQRGGEIVEPMVSTQWFVKMQPLAEPALEAVRSGSIKIIPERFTKVYYNWLENIRDWCISRQLWWGHRIPAWHCGSCQEISVARQLPERCPKCGSTELEQDPDVLDTWFSSGLWPFSTLGWPEHSADMRDFYPTSMMETGYDILFFWVARMIMMGLEFTGKPPFDTIYLHGLIRDELGRKMSKTLGNVVDPLDLMDQYGTDALRYTLLTGSTPGNDMSLSLQRVEANRNFMNKLWNAGRLVLAAVESAADEPEQGAEPTLADRWIESRRLTLIREVNRLFDNFQYGEAGRQIHEFLWGDLADWYLEIAKLQLEQGGDRAWLTIQTMIAAYDSCLRLLHPFAPFVTEELWGFLKEACLGKPGLELGGEQALIVAGWPEPKPVANWEAPIQAEFGICQELVTSIRNVRSEKAVESGRRIEAWIRPNEAAATIEACRSWIAALARLNERRLRIMTAGEDPPADSVPLVVGPVQAYLPLAGMVDLERERSRVEGELQTASAQIRRIEELLAGPFAERAPREVVAKEQAKLQGLLQTADRLREQLDRLAEDQILR